MLEYTTLCTLSLYGGICRVIQSDEKFTEGDHVSRVPSFLVHWTCVSFRCLVTAAQKIRRFCYEVASAYRVHKTLTRTFQSGTVVPPPLPPANLGKLPALPHKYLT